MATPERRMHSRFIDMTGQRYGRLTVLEYLRGPARWLCQCECGGTSEVRRCHLVGGQTTSCGCYMQECRSISGRSHGCSHGSAEYKSWLTMRKRCSDPKHTKYAYYGGRGVVVCAEWQHDFLAFFEHIGPKPTPKHQVDRIDGSKGYEPGNVRWATAKQQCRNTSRNVWLEVGGERRCMSEWAEIRGVSVQTIWSRLKRGWTPERAVNTPPRPNRGGG